MSEMTPEKLRARLKAAATWGDAVDAALDAASAWEADRARIEGAEKMHEAIELVAETCTRLIGGKYVARTRKASHWRTGDDQRVRRCHSG